MADLLTRLSGQLEFKVDLMPSVCMMEETSCSHSVVVHCLGIISFIKFYKCFYKDNNAHFLYSLLK